MELTTRNASLQDLAALLKDQHGHKLDMIVPASKLRAVDASLVVSGAEPVITDEGVTSADGVYVPTTICDEQVSEKLGVPVGYLKRLRNERPDLYDANVNGWLHGGGEVVGADEDRDDVTQFPGDVRSFMLRTFKGDDEGPGIARALLSDRYAHFDHFDVLTQTLEGVREAGVEVIIDACDLTERRMYVTVICPEITALAPVLLKGYRSPFADGNVERAAPSTAPSGYWNQHRAQHFAELGDRYGWDGDMPLVFAGFKIGNSETGGGAFSITPELRVLSCWNGLTITQDVLRKVHVGGKLDEGVVRWSEDTQRKSLDLVKAQTRDAVTTFLDVDYITKVIDRIEADAAKPVAKPDECVRTIGKTLRFSEQQIDGVLDHFIRGGQVTAGGVLNAVTSYAQCIVDADAAHEFGDQAMRAFELAVAAN